MILYVATVTAGRRSIPVQLVNFLYLETIADGAQALPPTSKTLLINHHLITVHREVLHGTGEGFTLHWIQTYVLHSLMMSLQCPRRPDCMSVENLYSNYSLIHCNN